MIPPAILILILIILVIFVGAVWPRMRGGQEEVGGMLALKSPSLIAKQKANKEANKRRVLDLFAGMPEGKLTNFDLEILLGVRESTATRYLEELEKEGKVRKIGMTGHQVYYEKIQPLY